MTDNTAIVSARIEALKMAIDVVTKVNHAFTFPEGLYDLADNNLNYIMYGEAAQDKKQKTLWMDVSKNDNEGNN